MQFFSVTPLIETGVQNTSYKASVYNPALLRQLAWNLGNGFGFSYAFGVPIPMSTSQWRGVRPRSISGIVMPRHRVGSVFRQPQSAVLAK